MEGIPSFTDEVGQQFKKDRLQFFNWLEENSEYDEDTQDLFFGVYQMGYQEGNAGLRAILDKATTDNNLLMFYRDTTGKVNYVGDPQFFNIKTAREKPKTKTTVYGKYQITGPA